MTEPCATVWCRGKARPKSEWCIDCKPDSIITLVQQDDDDEDDEARIIKPVTYPYDVICMLCGRSYESKMPEQLALTWQRYGNVRCDHCRGRMLIERADMGHIGSANASRIALR